MATVSQPVCIGANVWVGCGRIVLKNVTMGGDFMVGLGSVVRSNAPAGAGGSGNLATLVKTFASLTGRSDARPRAARVALTLAATGDQSRSYAGNSARALFRMTSSCSFPL